MSRLQVCVAYEGLPRTTVSDKIQGVVGLSSLQLCSDKTFKLVGCLYVAMQGYGLKRMTTTIIMVLLYLWSLRSCHMSEGVERVKAPKRPRPVGTQKSSQATSGLQGSRVAIERSTGETSTLGSPAWLLLLWKLLRPICWSYLLRRTDIPHTGAIIPAVLTLKSTEKGTSSGPPIDKGVSLSLFKWFELLRLEFDHC
ncbi:hypothetical protein NE237_026125 [Protea cynaroides]|uniref:Uncharacterized protein n=1 Tax=Protea cynaroides TaxID=273540 RepID=A0A9Q0K073_9MAGN|nr:hypothetical protein NE237_026125 [Protea cynaroides]